jgi:hypothetical protein
MGLSGGKHERIQEPQRVVLRAKLGRSLGDRRGQRDDGDSHACDRIMGVLQASGSSERDQGFAVGTGRRQELMVGSVGLVDLVRMIDACRDTGMTPDTGAAHRDEDLAVPVEARISGGRSSPPPWRRTRW